MSTSADDRLTALAIESQMRLLLSEMRALVRLVDDPRHTRLWADASAMAAYFADKLAEMEARR